MPTYSPWTSLAVRSLPAAFSWVVIGDVLKRLVKRDTLAVLGTWHLRTLLLCRQMGAVLCGWRRRLSPTTSRLRTSPMTGLCTLLCGFIQSSLIAIKLFTCLKLLIIFKNNARKIVQEVAGRILMRRLSSNVASIWLDIGQFWGNLAKSLTDADLDVDE